MQPHAGITPAIDSTARLVSQRICGLGALQRAKDGAIAFVDLSRKNPHLDALVALRRAVRHHVF